MSIEAVKQKLAGVEELPALPTIIAEINDLLGNPGTTAPQLSRVIMKDPTITGKILKIVNSSFFGLPKRLSSVNQAIIVLGFNTVRSIVLCTSVIESMGKARSSDAIDHKKFWAFSVGVAAGGKVLARNANEKKIETAFVAGLLQGIGKIVLDRFFHNELITSFKLAKDRNLTLWDAEREVMGVSDAEIAGVLLAMWKLDNELVQAVTHQEYPANAREHAALASYTLIAGMLARALKLGDAGDIHVSRLTPEIVGLAKVDPAQWPRLLELTEDEAKKASIFVDPS